MPSMPVPSRATLDGSGITDVSVPVNATELLLNTLWGVETNCANDTSTDPNCVAPSAFIVSTSVAGVTASTPLKVRDLVIPSIVKVSRNVKGMLDERFPELPTKKVPDWVNDPGTLTVAVTAFSDKVSVEGSRAIVESA